MTSPRRILAIFVLLWTFPGVSPAGDGRDASPRPAAVPKAAAVPRAAALPQWIRAAEGDFLPAGEKRLDHAHRLLDQALERLTQRLEQAGKNGAAWRAYLRIDQLQQELAKGTRADPGLLRSLRKRWVGTHAGLELPVFTEVRDALAAYAQVLEDLADTRLQSQFHAHLHALADAVEAHTTKPSNSSWEQIAEHLGWLEQHGQVPNVTQAVRRLAYPNLVIHVSEQLVDAYLGATIDETGPVRDVILGTPISGTGRTRGEITASLLPHDRFGLVQLEINALNRARTVGTRRGVRIYQNNVTQLNARKQVLLDPRGFQPLPARSEASVQAWVTGLETTLRGCVRDRLVGRAALRKWYQQAPVANRIAESRQQQRLNRQFDHEVNLQMAEGYAELADRLLSPLARQDAYPRQLDTRSDHERLSVHVQEAGSGQLGAPCAPPSHVEQGDLLIQLHGSVVDNYAQSVLAGTIVTAEEIFEAAQRLRNGPQGPSSQSSSGDIAVLLAPSRPITLQIDEGILTLTIRGRRFVARRQSYPAMNISLRYRLQLADGALHAVLLNDFDNDEQAGIFPPRITEGGPQRLSGREATLRRMLLNRLKRDLDREIVYEGITPEGKLSSLGRLPVVRFAAEDGWLSLALALSRPLKKAAGTSPSAAKLLGKPEVR